MINAAVKKYNMLSEGQGRLRYGIVSKLLDSATNKKKKNKIKSGLKKIDYIRMI